jgi:hypothetical protein
MSMVLHSSFIGKLLFDLYSVEEEVELEEIFYKSLRSCKAYPSFLIGFEFLEIEPG